MKKIKFIYMVLIHLPPLYMELKLIDKIQEVADGR